MCVFKGTHSNLIKLKGGVSIAIIDSLTDTKLFVEKQRLLEIKVDSKHNNLGILEHDVNNNLLVSIVDLGDCSLYRLSECKNCDSVLIYSPSTNKKQLVREGEYVNVPLDFEKGTKYYLNAKEVICTKTEDSEYTFNINEKVENIFSVTLGDGTEVTNYTIKDNTLVVQGLFKMLIDDFSEITIISYQDTVVNNEELVFEYYGYETIFNREDMLNESYFDFPRFKGREINMVDDIAFSSKKRKKKVGQFDTRFRQKQVNTDVQNTFTLKTFSNSDAPEIFDYIGSDEFRFIAINPLYGRVLLCNNCVVDEGVSLSLQKQKNLKYSKITFGNYIDITASERDAYGEGQYGEGIYSGNWIYNSNKRR